MGEVYYISIAIAQRSVGGGREAAWTAPTSLAGYLLRGKVCRPTLVHTLEHGEGGLGSLEAM